VRASSLSELAILLSRERDVLEQLAGSLGDDAHEAAAVAHALRSLELHRAITVREAAVELQIAGDSTLRTLIASAPPAWAAVLDDHHRGLTETAERIRGIARAGADSASIGGADVAAMGGRDSNVVALAGVRNALLPRSLRDFLA